MRTGGLRLSWVNAIDPDFDVVRVLRSEDFYLTNPFAGRVVYEGAGTTVIDVETEKGKTYYYTIFSRDGSGNYSSGSIVLGQTSPALIPLVLEEQIVEQLIEGTNPQQLIETGVTTQENIIELEQILKEDPTSTQVSDSALQRYGFSSLFIMYLILFLLLKIIRYSK